MAAEPGGRLALRSQGLAEVNWPKITHFSTSASRWAGVRTISPRPGGGQMVGDQQDPRGTDYLQRSAAQPVEQSHRRCSIAGRHRVAVPPNLDYSLVGGVRGG